MGEQFNILTLLIALEKEKRDKELVDRKQITRSLLENNNIIRRRVKSATCTSTEVDISSREFKTCVNDTEPSVKPEERIGDNNMDYINSFNLRCHGDRKKLSSKFTSSEISAEITKYERPQATHISSSVNYFDRNLRHQYTDLRHQHTDLRHEHTDREEVKTTPSCKTNKIRLNDKNGCIDTELSNLKKPVYLRYHHAVIKKPMKSSMLQKLKHHVVDSVDFVSAANRPEDLKLPSLNGSPPLSSINIKNKRH